MTRPRAQSIGFVDALPGGLAERLAPIISPLIEIAPLDAAVSVEPHDAVIFTSTNGVDCASPGQGQTAYCVGPATTQAALQKGWYARQCGETSAELVAYLKKLHPETRIWHLAGVHTRGSVAQKLCDSGINVSHIPLYDQATPPLTVEALNVLKAEKPVILPLFSPRTATQFARQAPAATGVHAISISEAVAENIARMQMETQVIAGRPNAGSMVEAIEKRVQFLEMG